MNGLYKEGWSIVAYEFLLCLFFINMSLAGSFWVLYDIIVQMYVSFSFIISSIFT